MKKLSFSHITGVMLILAFLAATIGQISIMRNFDWEGRPYSEILVMYHNSGTALQISWSIFALGAFLMIPSALLLHKIFHHKHTPFLYIGTTFGVIAGMAYIIGIMRWVLFANMFSAMYVAQPTNENTEQMIELIFQAMNVYAGNSFGETIAPIAHAIWLIILGCAMFKKPICGRWLAIAQILFGIVIAFRPLEYVGLKTLVLISDVGVLLWTVMLLVFGILLLLAKEKMHVSEAQGA
ncbi:hypothetical protein U14_05252 [Candidatus Moduliflexus flocculans]|uniref:DUF4386 domain-containing protein n=1 Tax=Candidatus Moduliflexus flocculans TaxID=1499966 RepID=A0A081BRE4_9BACT|nr:hypothetical protein U14_05252 [Candidatus Moduliflexus flocculans]